MTHNKKVLFVLKRRSAYGVSYGLVNSAGFVARFLNSIGIEAKVVEVVDNNCIDKEVHKFKPTHVIIEALWVVPEKFNILCKIHKNVKWLVRLHSKTPFLANEGVAMEWLAKYKEIKAKFRNFNVSANSTALINEIESSLELKISYTPNIYFPPTFETVSKKRDKKFIDVGCFGAIRPMKNHLIQAMAAIKLANKLGLTLRFHINGGRCEQRGENVEKNLNALFKATKHSLVTHDWMNHTEFLKLVCKMDIGMQVSFSETFNIVAADFAYANIPIIGSDEIEWLSYLYRANPNKIDSIYSKMLFSYHTSKFGIQKINKFLLIFHNFLAGLAWKKELNVA